MRWRLGNALLYLLLLAATAAGTGSLVLGRPVLATVIKSYSMEPVYTRGDVAILWNWPGRIEPGDIVLFRPTSGALTGQWTLHRVVGVDQDGHFLTRGDAAQDTDQQDRLAGPVRREDVVARAVTVAGVPLRIPWIGQLALRYAPQRQNFGQAVLVPALILMVLLAAVGLARPRPRRRRGREVDSRLLFAGVGAILSTLLMAMTMFQTVRMTLVYEVGPRPAVVMGQPLGIITPGEVVTKRLASLSNRGFMPMYLLLTERDPNLVADAGLEVLRPGAARQVTVEVTGSNYGSFRSLVELSLVFPLLPLPAVRALARIDHWAGALAGCLLPGLLVTLAGLLEPSSRRRSARDVRALVGKMRGLLTW